MANEVNNKIRKIFRSYNFFGNKIINATVDTPTKPGHITSKEFVDLSVTYNTEIVNAKNDSSRFSWMTGLKNLTIKQVLDKLLFAEALPIFKNPSLNGITLYPEDVQLFGLQYIVFNGANLKGKLKYDLVSLDRPALSNTILKVTYPDNSEVNFEDIDNNGEIDFEFVYNKDATIELTRTYDQAPPKKLDDGETDYVEPGFEVQYDMVIDITNALKNNLVIYESPLISPSRLGQAVPDYDSTFIFENFTTGPSKDFVADEELIYDMLIPSSIMEMSEKYKYVIGFVFFDDNGEYNFDTKVALPRLKRFTNGDKITHNGIEYVKYQYNFGVMSFTGKFLIDFTNIRNSEHLINQ